MLSLPDFKSRQIVFAFLSRGEKLSFRNDNLIIKEDEGKIRYQVSCHRLFALLIVGHATITSGLLQRAKKFGFSIQLLTHGLRTYGGWYGAVEGNTLLRSKQYNYDEVALANYIIIQKIERQILILKKRRKKNCDLKEKIKMLENHRSKIEGYNLEFSVLLGVEGSASRIYFKAFFEEFGWRSRCPRAKQDRLNLLLDIGYSQLFYFIETLLHLYGFDVYKGVYHQTFYQRKSLVCDLVEPFRTLIDAKLYKALRLGQINEDDFEKINGQYRIFGKKSQPYVTLFLEELMKYKEEIFSYIQKYYRSFMRDFPVIKYPKFLSET